MPPNEHEFVGDDRLGAFLTGHPGTDAQILMMRLDARISTFISTQTIRDEALGADIKYLRESSTTKFADHESRLRAIEGRRYVESRTVWVAIGAATAAGSLIVSIISAAMK